MRFNSLSLIVLFLFCAQGIKAGTPDSTDHYPFFAGTKALQFRVSPDFSLSPFQGSLISYQKQLTSEKARRIGISFSTSLWDGEGSHKDHGYNSSDSTYDTNDNTYTQNNNNSVLSISVQKIKYTPLKPGFYSYRGVGPTFGFSYSILDINPGSDAGNRTKNISKKIYIGFSFVMGVEWFIKSNMSLLAEYRPSVLAGYKYTSKYRKSIDSSGSYQIRDDLIKGPTFNISSGVKFGLSIYL